MHIIFLIFFAFLTVWITKLAVHLPLDIANAIHLPPWGWLIVLTLIFSWGLGD